MAPAPSAPAGDNGGAILALAILIGGLGFGGWLLWQEQHALISAIAMRILYGEIRVIHLFTSRFDMAASQLLTTDPEHVRFDQLVRLARETGRFFLIPSIAIVAASAVLCLRYTPPARFCRRLRLEDLMRELARSFRGAAAFSERRLSLVKIREGEPRPLDAALSVEEWVACWATGKNGKFDRPRARAELVRQLGGHWLGPSDASPAVRCMLWAAALHLAGRRAGARNFLGALSESLRLHGKKEGPEGPAAPFAFPQALIKAADTGLRISQEGQRVCAIASRHGFEVTGLMSALVEARRESGVLAPAQFAFLKLVDRRLWYALHSLGSPADALNPALHPNPCVEAIGARDHWAVECAAQKPVFFPAVDRAAAAIAAVMRAPQED